LAQLIWMRTEDLAAATVAMNAQLKAGPVDIPLYLARAKLLEFAGDIDAAYASLAVPLDGGSSSMALQVTAALLIMPRDAEKGLEHAETAYGMAPELGPQASALCQAYLAMGRAKEAAELAESLRREWPLDQLPVTLAATAWRLLGDERYHRLYDYDRLVFRQTIETPKGWPDLDSYLRELAASLRRLLVFRGHPIGQSLRSGVQTGQSLVLSDDPAIKALFAVLDAPIRAYIDRLRGHDDVLGTRVNSGYRYASAWSVELRPGGRHVDHTHPLGWISSAFHVELPAATEDGRQGWLKFGEPGLPTSPVLGPDHFVKPRAGQLVLFPSYMWHGTVPFGGDASRLTIAFDALPA
jgi:tetratricopeptide (TPR) repeat protein